MRIKSFLLTASLVFFLFSLFFSASAADHKYQFTKYDKLVASDAIKWVISSDSENVKTLKFDYLKNQLLDSNFHASLAANTYGTLIDFITTLSNTYPLKTMEVLISNFQTVTDKPYSPQNPLVSTHCTLTVVYKPNAGKNLAYSFKFLYYSDKDKLKEMAKENGFPNIESMDGNTSLIMIKEMVTDTYPDGFTKMDTASFNQLLITPLRTVLDYIELTK